MPTIPIDVAILQELLLRKDELVRAITDGSASGKWEPVMGAFDGLMAALTQLEGTVRVAQPAQDS